MAELNWTVVAVHTVAAVYTALRRQDVPGKQKQHSYHRRLDHVHTAATINQLHAAGVSSIVLSLDGSTPAQHDAFRGVAGSFAWTKADAQAIVAKAIPLQVNTLVSAQTLDDRQGLAHDACASTPSVG